MFLYFSNVYKTNQNSCAYVDIGPVQPAVRLRAAVVVLAGEAVERAVLRDLDVVETLVVLQEPIEVSPLVF